ncbi:MAG: beta-propeller fold lactonase family protein, partial [Clostridia bacterium]|nr:beta-propeller fold lactonase family protein [Clostridia bacterium]
MRKRILAALLFSVLAMSALPTARASGENYRYFIYAANYNDNNVSAYSANADTGVLTQLPGSPYAAGQYPASVTATAGGEYIYVTNQGDGTVSAYAVDQESGALTEIAGSPFSTSTYEDEDHSPEPVASVVSPDGGRLYVANRYNNNIKVFAIGSSGALSSEGYMIDFNGVSTPLANCSVAVHPSGRYLYAANMHSRSISAFNTDTLQRLPNSPFDTGVCPRSVAVHPGGQLLYAANWGEETITGYWIGETDGSLSPVAGSPFATVGDDPTALLILGDTLYVTNGYSHNIAVYAIDTATGALTEIAGSPFESGNWPNALASDTGGAFLYVVNSLVGNVKNVRGYTIDSSTGALAAVAGNPFDSGDYTMGIAVVRVAAGSPVCEIVGGMQYETLDAAIADVPASTPTTIRLLQTIERTSMLAIDGARRITLDLNGYNLNINVASGTALEVSQGSSLTTAGVGAMNAMGEEYGINTTQSSTVNITGNVSATAYAGVYAYGSDSSVTVIGNVGGYIGVLSGNTASVTVTGNVAGDNVAILATESSNIQVTGEATGTSFGVQANTNAEAIVAGNVRTTSPDSTGLLLSSGAAVTVSGDVDAGRKGVSASEGSGARVEGSVTTVSDAGYGFAAYAQSGARVEIGGDAITAAETGVAAETSGLVFVTGDVQGKYYGIAVSRGAEVFVHGDVIAVLYGGAGVNAYSVGKATIDGTIQADRAMVFGESDGALVTPTTKPGYLTYSDGQGSFIWVYDPDAVPFITLTTEKAPGSAIYFTSITAAEADLPGVWIDLNDNGVKDDGEELGSPKTVSSPTIRIYGKVTGLICRSNSLTELDVSNNTALTSLDVYYNGLTALDVSNNMALTTLNLQHNSLTALDVSNNAALKTLNCSENMISSLNLGVNTQLTNLQCAGCGLTALDVSAQTAIAELNCRNNAIAALDLSSSTALVNLYCTNNALTALTLPQSTTVKRVECEKNLLTAVDVSHVTEMTVLNCAINRLAALDVSQNTKLMQLKLYSNKIKGAAMTAIVSALPTAANVNNYKIYVIDTAASPADGNVAFTSDVSIATGKNWNVLDWKGGYEEAYAGAPLAVQTGEILDLAATGALILGEVTGDGGDTVTERGVVYSTVSDPTLVTGTAVTADEAGTGEFDATLAGLSPNTTYYVRAYATNGSGTAYGAVRRFATPVSVATVTMTGGSMLAPIAVNETTNKIYAGSLWSGRIYVLDGDTDTVDTAVTAGSRDFALAINKTTNKVYSASGTSAYVTDGATNTVKTIALSAGAYAVALNEQTNKIYVTSENTATPLYVINGASDTIEATVVTGTKGCAIAVNEAENEVYVADDMGGKVVVINGTDNTVKATVTVGTRPRDIAVNETTHMLYVVNWGNLLNDGSVTVIDGDNDFAAQTIALGTKAYPYDAAVNETTNKIYVSLSAFNSVLVIDGADNSTEIVPVGVHPSIIAVNEDTNRVYITNVNEDDRSAAGYTVTGIDGDTLETVGFADADGPTMLAVSQSTNKVYVTNFSAGTVTVIALAPPAVVIVAGTATDDAAILQIDNKTPSARNKTWDINVTIGTVKAGLTASDVTLTGLPAGLSYTAAKGTGNNIVITLTGTAATALTADVDITAVIKGSAVTEASAQDSVGIPLKLWYIGADTTFVLTNEAGGLIDTLIAAGHGSKNLYQVMQLLQPVSGGTITDRFMMTLASNEAASEIFTAKLNDVAVPTNSPIGINADGTLIVVPIYGRQYHGQTGYSTYPDTPEAGRELFTYAEGPQYYIAAGSSGPGTSYYAFAIAWAAAEPTTFVLSNEEGGLIDELIAAGYGNRSLYEALVALKASSGGVITDDFLEALRGCPPDSEAFTDALSNYAGLNNPVCVNTDGTLTIQPIFGRDYHGRTGYSTYPESSGGARRERFTYAASPAYYIDAGQSDTEEAKNYYAFAIAWSAINLPPEVRVLKPAAGVVWTGEQTIEWEAADPDDDASKLKISLEYALAADGSAWQSIAANQANTG